MAELDTMTESEAPLSTQLDEGGNETAQGGSAPKISEPASVRDDIAAAAREIEAKEADKAEAKEKAEPEEKPEAKADDKPKVEAKPEAKADAKPKADAEADEGGEGEVEAGESADAKNDGGADERQDAKDKGRPKLEAPQNFLPTAKEKWANVPHEVRSEVHRVIADAEAAATQYRESSERYEQLRQFDEAARSNGIDLRESLTRVAQIEDMMIANPVAGLNAILMQAGPRKPDGQPYSLYEVAEAIVRGGQQNYMQNVRYQPPQQQAQAPNEIQVLQAEIERMKAESKVNPVIERFRVDHPRYDELEGAIAQLLKAGIVPASLSVPDRLSAAYDMAVRLNPSATDQPANSGGEAEAKDRAAPSLGGSSKSIKSSPGSVTEDIQNDAEAGETVLDSIRKAARGLKR